MKEVVVGLTWTRLAMSWGSMERGKRRMLKRERDTNAFSASRTFSSDDRTYTANVVSDTCFKHTHNVSVIQFEETSGGGGWYERGRERRSR